MGQPVSNPALHICILYDRCGCGSGTDPYSFELLDTDPYRYFLNADPDPGVKIALQLEKNQQKHPLNLYNGLFHIVYVFF